MAEIEKQFRTAMNDIAQSIDVIFNGFAKGKERKTGFVLLVFPFNDGHGDRCNYISNGASRKDIAVLFREMAARFEGQPEVKGHG
jgi:hypothetical protein